MTTQTTHPKFADTHREGWSGQYVKSDSPFRKGDLYYQRSDPGKRIWTFVPSFSLLDTENFQKVVWYPDEVCPECGGAVKAMWSGVKCSACPWWYCA